MSELLPKNQPKPNLDNRSNPDTQPKPPSKHQNREGPPITVSVSGYFNPVHKGHIEMFREAKKLGDKLVVIINSDKQVDIKGSQKFMDENERKHIVESIRYVDEAIISIDEDKTICKTLELLKPTIFANGGDRKNPDDIPEAKVCQEHNIKMVFNVGGGKVQSSSWLLAQKNSLQKRIKPPNSQIESASNPQINFKEKNTIIADVDDTICESCQVISPEMAEQISKMIDQGYHFAFISGTKSESLQRMISSRLKKEHHILGTTGTNYTHIKENDPPEIIYKHALTDEEKKEIMDAFDKLINHYNIQTMTTKEDQVQDRESQITLSAIGRHAPTELKAQYDPDGGKRRIWAEFLHQYLDESKYHIKIGGTTSVDITKKGFDKEWGIRKFAEHKNLKHNEILFFGDKLHPGGNDYPATKVVDCIAVKNPEDTLKKLKDLIESRSICH